MGEKEVVRLPHGTITTVNYVLASALFEEYFQLQTSPSHLLINGALTTRVIHIRFSAKTWN